MTVSYFSAPSNSLKLSASFTVSNSMFSALAKVDDVTLLSGYMSVFLL